MSSPHPTPSISAKCRGFTLLELLVVVGILAIIAGAILTTYDGFKQRAANSATAHTLTTLTQTLHAYNTTEQHLPDQLESLVSAIPTNPEFNAITLHTSAVGVSGAEPLSILTEELAAAFEPRALSIEQWDNLREAGMRSIRFVDKGADANEASNSFSVFNTDGDNSGSLGPINSILNPNLAFEPADPSGRNLGRGFYLELGPLGTDLLDAKLMVWGGQGTGVDGTILPTFANTVINARPLAVVVGLGIGKSSTVVSPVFRLGSDSSQTTMVTAPFDAGVRVNQYGHFVALYDVQSSPARFIGVVDARGVPAGEKDVLASGRLR